MVDQVQGAMSSLEQYRMAMNIISMWETYRMPVMYAFGALLVLTIVLFVMKSCWKKWILFLAILAGLAIVGFDGFKMYVEYKKKEAIKSALVAPIEGIANAVTEVVTEPLSGAAKKVTEGVKGLLK